MKEGRVTGSGLRRAFGPLARRPYCRPLTLIAGNEPELIEVIPMPLNAFRHLLVRDEQEPDPENGGDEGEEGPEEFPPEHDPGSPQDAA